MRAILAFELLHAAAAVDPVVYTFIPPLQVEAGGSGPCLEQLCNATLLVDTGATTHQNQAHRWQGCLVANAASLPETSTGGAFVHWYAHCQDALQQS